MTAPSPSVWVGLDVAKAHIDVAVLPTSTRLRVPNDEGGHATLVATLTAAAPTLIVLEATGGYETAVATAVALARLPVAVVNPRQVRDFARATSSLPWAGSTTIGFSTMTSQPASSASFTRA